MLARVEVTLHAGWAPNVPRLGNILWYHGAVSCIEELTLRGSIR
jgi:hypothetical protein